ncbi:FUSC family protein [Acuticoccus sp. M5D2P5]|uniref:FUSC family protein n=1 Tax=Acuticoccus kalidii TaxID=2910977 RepID=UPI001F32110D|nr:FUSC family protein [Acuticoccus kalidii]MCF3932032.1 FUSC family protein [Acuticoccus kalidii]
MNTASDLPSPNSWLRELARLKPARWPWGRSIRAGICVGLPFVVGVLTGEIMTGMWVALSTLLFAAGEKAGSYRSIFQTIAIAAPIGALGYFAGYLTALPWPALLGVMAVVGFVAGLISSYGAALSIGAMQALLVASIAIGIPAIAPFWQPAALFLVGGALYAAVLGLEALLFPRLPRHQAFGDLLAALADLARARAREGAVSAETGSTAIEAARRTVTEQLSALYAMLLDTRYDHDQRDPESDLLAAKLHHCDTAFAELMSSNAPASLEAAATRLGQVAAAMKHGRPLPAAATPIGEPRLSRTVEGLVASCSPGFRPDTGATGMGVGANPPRQPLSVKLDRLLPGQDAVRSALALSLCLVLAYASHWVIDANHWFWVPLTVSLVMKPDFGSIFARAVLRCVGTLGGVVIGAIALASMSKGVEMAIAIGIFAAFIPWAMMRSYALQALVLTPLILVFVDIIIPGIHNVDYAVQRLQDTVIGSVIVLVFGYFLWPKPNASAFAATLHGAMQSVADYLRAVTAWRDAPTASRQKTVAMARRQAYRRLAGIRAQLQKAMAEPAPAGRDAVAWFPLVASAERICDQITAASATSGTVLSHQEREALEALAREIAAAPGAPILPDRRPDEREAADNAFMSSVTAELSHIRRLVEPAPT